MKMRRSVPRSASGAIALLLLLPTAPVHAAGSGGESEEAKRKAYAGVQAYQAGDCQKALVNLEPAFTAIQAPSVGLWSARALEKCGKWVEAAARYREVLQLPAGKGDSKIQEQARADAAQEAQALATRLPHVDFRIENADLTMVHVTFDGEPMNAAELRDGRAANPGAHEIVGVKGDEHVAVSVVARESAHQLAVLKFAGPAQPVAAAPLAVSPPRERSGPAADAHHGSSPMRGIGLVAMGVGGAGLVFAGVSALVAVGNKPSSCKDNVCQPSDQAGVDSYNSWRTVSTISFWSGAAVAAAGAALFFTAPASSSTVALRVTPTHAEIRGSF